MFNITITSCLTAFWFLLVPSPKKYFRFDKQWSLLFQIQKVLLFTLEAGVPLMVKMKEVSTLCKHLLRFHAIIALILKLFSVLASLLCFLQLKLEAIIFQSLQNY